MDIGREVFRRYVELLRKSGQPDHFYNHFPWQTRIVADNILDFALEGGLELDVFSSDFELYSDGVYEKMSQLAARQVRVRLILAEYPQRDCLNAISKLSAQPNIRISYMRKYDEQLNHLWLAGTAYRFELPHPKRTASLTDYQPEFPAQFAFHDKERSELVRSYWNSRVLRATMDELSGRVCEEPVLPGMRLQPMSDRQDADATKSHGQDARATSHTHSQSSTPEDRSGI